MIPVLERAKIVRALDRAATGIGSCGRSWSFKVEPRGVKLWD
jgi:hypothetical protein